MARCIVARDEKLNRDVRFKVLPADLSGNAERLHRIEPGAEAAGVAESSKQPRGFYDVGVHDGAPYVVFGTTRR
jgi:hypothetical protein